MQALLASHCDILSVSVTQQYEYMKDLLEPSYITNFLKLPVSTVPSELAPSVLTSAIIEHILPGAFCICAVALSLWVMHVPIVEICA